MVQPCGERQERGVRATERRHAHTALHELQRLSLGDENVC